MKLSQFFIVLGALCLGLQANAQTRYVVSVGCQPEKGGLNFLDSDARLVADVLKGSSSQVTLMTSEDPSTKFPTRSEIVNQIDQVCSQAKASDSVWLYFSCHGDQKNGDGKSYLLTPKTRGSSDFDLLAVSDIRQQLKEKCKAKVVVLMIDACHSGSYKSAPFASRPEAAFGGVNGIVTLAGCSVNQTSLELPELRHGLFTFFLVKGLGGEAKGADGKMTLSTLGSYIKENVSKVAKAHRNQQDPVVLISGTQGAEAVQPGNPGAASVLPDINPETAQVQLTNPLPPGIVLSIQGASSNDNADLLESSIGEILIGNRYPIFGSEQSRQYEDVLNNRDTVEAAKQAARMNARFLLRMKVKVSTTRQKIGSVESITGECVLTLQLIDSDGKVIATDSGAAEDGTPARGPGFTEEAAVRAAIKNAVANGMRRLLPKMEQARLKFPQGS